MLRIYHELINVSFNSECLVSYLSVRTQNKPLLSKSV